MPTTQATYDDANLILRLYELRREEKLREAREWFAGNFNPSSFADVNRIAPPGSKENSYMRMVASYWETAASFVAAGVLNQDLFFQSSGEMLVVWERMRPLIQELRAMFKNPNSFRHLETVGNAYIKYMEAQGPEAYPAFQAMVAGMAAGKSE
jgi:hypothetical protein